MRGLSRLLVAILVMGLAGSSFAGTYGGGSGTEEYPYQIGTAEHLIALGTDPNDYDKCFVMTADIDMGTYNFNTAVIAPDANDSSEDFVGYSFTGSFDGNGNFISNLTVEGVGYLGLFGYIGEGGSVSNFGLMKVNIIGTGFHVGGLAGYCKGSVTSCYSTGVVNGTGYRVGGLCGFNYEGSIDDCYSAANVTGGDGSGWLGGLCGSIEDGSIVNCYATGEVSGGDGSFYIGGLCGNNNCGSIDDSYATGGVSGGSSSVRVGGLCGDNDGSIDNCYASGPITGGYIGGLCGGNEGSIDHCYATGRITGVNSDLGVGGFVGYNDDEDGSINNCFWDTDTAGVTSSDGGTGLPTTLMQTMSTFINADWDFINAWNIGDNQTYPYLRTVPASDINKDKVVNLIDLGILAEQWMKEE